MLHFIEQLLIFYGAIPRKGAQNQISNLGEVLAEMHQGEAE